ncbi:MAG: AMIN domain-containing protein [Aphanizomenon flos-aquae KM1D3_PB]|uniref:type IV pilus secretin family protein n=1 Tax=Aphanizomenon flos-aquae TaxID=1176 RepID=UPI0005419BBF|nr:type IV pilus secretin family protein [Aphanizomenon flos-aquae]KHG42777.1 general secretion pathway protein GspD [Aphanizomenon flos-aquae 2012/KM1/D3]QSV70523.1 MAG: AMIN domain-containing protein [Aphanizomenon flos-aquae KM1D3_PB]
MKQFHNSVFVSSAAACVLLAAQPVLAQLTQITDVKLNPIEGGISVILKTAAGNRPQVFTTKKDKSLIADVINAQLRLPKGDNFRQENPAPGIKIIEVKQLDANSIRVIVTGVDDAPSNQPVMRKDNNLTLGFTTTTNSTASTATKPTEKVSAAPATTPESKPEPGKPPDVLVPNPQVTIDGKIAQSAGPNQPYNQAPPFLPRAVAPPVGDITQSNIDTSPTVIDLGTQERVPRLVLRDAPVREVLSLLARAANLNVVYIGGEAEKAQGADATKTSQTISLDIENEPVQDVFNYVLRLSALEANRTGRTIFVGTKLPNSTRDTVMRSLRLNQVTVGTALNFLVALGAESAVSRERLVTSVNAVPVGNATAPITQTQTTTETKIETQRIEYKDSTPLLRGLQASGDERTNSVTLIGNPKMVEMAVSQLVQLDVRRRQVVVNVKIIDVNLSGIQDSNSSFSFGLGNSYFTSDGGAATFNFGGSRPATGSEVASSVTETPITTNPLSSANIFLDKRDSSTGNPTAGASSNPEVTGVKAITPTEITYELPKLYQFPKKFLASLTAQVTSGNAKILTDPTLIVQEGQEARVGLTEEVYGGIEIITNATGGTTRKPIIKEAGLSLTVRVERIDDNGFVSLSVAPTVSAPGGTATTVDGSIGLITGRSLQSGVLRLRDGQTLILSGIIQDQDRTSITKLPILGDIPLLGSLFRSSNRVNERREVIVLMTPQIMDDSERSSYGYNYTPSPQIRQILERRGLKVQPR